MAKIMLCDGSVYMRMLEKDMLLAEGHEIVGEATNGWEAVQLYPRCKPELVVMDVTMAELDSISAVKEIRRQDSMARIIMASETNQRSFLMEALVAGAIDFVIKPFKREQYLSVIDNALL